MSLYLIPTCLGNEPCDESIPQSVLKVLSQIRHFSVENEKSARAFLKKAGHPGPMQEITLFRLDEHSTLKEIAPVKNLLLSGVDVGVLSEAGAPCVADPGALLVSLAHEHGIRVEPLVGPSAILLALMGSGLNGQRFAFEGYLPVESDLRRKRISDAEKESSASAETKIFIETPYRSDALFRDLLLTLKDNTLLTIASGLRFPEQRILTRRVAEWKSNKVDIGKVPAMFLFLASLRS